MDGKISYCNTDLDLTSSDDLTVLAAFLADRGVHPLHVTQGADGLWYATFETDDQCEEPEHTIAAMIAVIESFDRSSRSLWSGCNLREFNVGYECGNEPWAFNQGLSNRLLRRIAAVRASLRITIYPDREQPADNI